MTVLYLTSDGEHMTIIRRTAVSGKTGFHMRHSDFCWEELGTEILGEELAEKFDESFVQPLDQNDNTGEKNELASLIGSFNPA